MNNKGNTVVEATLILPIFIFGMLALFEFSRCRLAENIVYEAAWEAAEYMAEYGYIAEGNLWLAQSRLEKYVDDLWLVDKYIQGGASGVSLTGSCFQTEENDVELAITYKLSCNIPFFDFFSHERSYTLKQHIYCGYEKEQGEEWEEADDEKYVYVTDNMEAYHTTRACTHLSLSISGTTKKQAEKNNFSPCEFCGDKCGQTVYITKYGDRYHSGKSCSGLKRTVKRVKLSEVEQIGACQRCGGYE
ncbi:MAG: pilus assembly protein [Clostridium sp.]|nr:pilus assembly protein [Clostridium sp.]